MTLLLNAVTIYDICAGFRKHNICSFSIYLEIVIVIVPSYMVSTLHYHLM